MAATTLTDRAVIRLTGDDVHGFLNGLVTNEVGGPLPVWAGLLTPQGKCLFEFIIWGDGDDLLLDCEEAAADDLIKRLSVYRLRRAITIARDESLGVHWSQSGNAGVSDPRLPSLGKRWIAPSTPARAGAQSGREAAVPTASGLLPSQENNWLEHRLRLGVCEGRAELGDLLWLECNAADLNGVSFTKGCFVGQENTARMNWRSKVNRRLFVVASGIAPVARVRTDYPDIGLSVAHLRVDELPDGVIRPDWISG